MKHFSKNQEKRFSLAVVILNMDMNCVGMFTHGRTLQPPGPHIETRVVHPETLTTSLGLLLVWLQFLDPPACAYDIVQFKY